MIIHPIVSDGMALSRSAIVLAYLMKWEYMFKLHPCLNLSRFDSGLAQKDSG